MSLDLCLLQTGQWMLNIANEISDVNIIQAYATTADKIDEEVEIFYEDIKILLT